MTRKVGDTYRPIVHILKMKNGRPTVIKVSGREFILRHEDQFRGRKGQKQVRRRRGDSRAHQKPG